MFIFPILFVIVPLAIYPLVAPRQTKGPTTPEEFFKSRGRWTGGS